MLDVRDAVRRQTDIPVDLLLATSELIDRQKLPVFTGETGIEANIEACKVSDPSLAERVAKTAIV